MEGTATEQDTILREMQALGYNVVECPACGIVLLVRTTDREGNDVDELYKCFICDVEFDSSDCSDLVFPDKNNNWLFANT